MVTLVVLGAACADPASDSGKEPWTEPSRYTLTVGEPIGAVAIDVGTDQLGPENEDGVCVLDDAGVAACTGPVPEPPAGTTLATLSVSATGGCGLLVSGGATCWGGPEAIVTRDLTDVVSISVLPTIESGQEEVCAVTVGGLAWCDGEQEALEVEGDDYTEVSTGEYGVGVQDADGSLWWRSFWEPDGSLQTMDKGVEAKVTAWTANSSAMILLLSETGEMYYTSFFGADVAPRVEAENVASVSVSPRIGVCWVDQFGKIGQDHGGGAGTTEEIVEPQEGYAFSRVACTSNSEIWAITTDGRVARLVWESDGVIPF